MTGKRRRYRAVVRLRTSLAGSFLRIPSIPGDSAVPLPTTQSAFPSLKPPNSTYLYKEEDRGRRRRRYSRAINTPGIFLSHPGTTTIPSNQCPPAADST